MKKYSVTRPKKILTIQTLFTVSYLIPWLIPVSSRASIFTDNPRDSKHNKINKFIKSTLTLENPQFSPCMFVKLANESPYEFLSDLPSHLVNSTRITSNIVPSYGVKLSQFVYNLVKMDWKSTKHNEYSHI